MVEEASLQLQPTFDVVRTTLSKGGRVWIVGRIDLPEPNTELPEMFTAPHPQFGWNIDTFITIWTLHLGHYLQQHATSLDMPVGQEKEGTCSIIENEALFVVEGWRKP